MLHFEESITLMPRCSGEEKENGKRCVLFLETPWEIDCYKHVGNGIDASMSKPRQSSFHLNGRPFSCRHTMRNKQVEAWRMG
jgi:hypothetical protein